MHVDLRCVLNCCVVAMESACQLNVSLDVSPTEANSQTGSAEITRIVGGSGRFTIQWTGGATTREVTNLAAGTYSVVIIDIIWGCNQSVMFTVGELPGE